MQDYMAPMEGITNYIYRNAYHRFFHPMDKYFTPFISAKPDKRLSFKEKNELSPENNKGMRVVPQILSNNAEDFIETARIFMDYGYREINLNLGCPSGTVTAKGKGSGFLGEPEMLERFLDEIYSRLPVEISIKTRIGTDYEEDWERLLGIYNKFPIKELIVHPRIQKDFYKFPVRPSAYELAQRKGKMPLCYNGDLFTKKDYEAHVARFPETETFMYGRGLIANPGLVGEIRDNKPMDKIQLRSFHDQIYHAYREILSGEKNVLFRMKELWAHMGNSFEDSGKHMKKIRKAQRCGEYEAAVGALFTEKELRV